MRSTLLRTVATTAVVALVATGCGLVGGQSVSTSDEVIAALRDLADSSMRARVTAEVNVDEGEVRDAVQADERLLSLMDDEADGASADDLLAHLEELRVELSQHAVLLARGDDRSVRFAVESQGTVWADVRARGAGQDGVTDGGLAASYPAELQLHMDWEHLEGLLEDSSIVDDISGAAATLRTLAPDVAAAVPAVAPILDVILGFLDGDEVGFTGAIDTAAWGEALGPIAGSLGFDSSSVTSSTADGLSLSDQLPDVDAYLATAFSFDGFRTDGGRTLVDVTVHVRDLATQMAQDAESGGAGSAATPQKLTELRASLEELPDELIDVATLAFDGGELTELRVDLFALAAQAGAAAEPDDEGMQALAGTADIFDKTGAFIVMSVADVGGVDTVLGAPTTTATWDDVLGAIEGAGEMLGPMFGGMLGLGAIPLPGLPSDGDLDIGLGSSPLSVSEIGVRDCFDDDALYGTADAGAQRVFPCALPHDNEVFAMVAFGGEDRDPASASAYDACLASFESTVGREYLESELFFAVLEPSVIEASAGADKAACYAFGPAPRTGSVTGSGA